MDTKEHINVLELKAAYLAIKHFCENRHHIHVQLLLDNTTAIKYISKMGGRIPKLNNLVKDLWLWCVKRDIWITAFHIFNVRADALSRQKLSDDMEWAINPNVLKQIMGIIGPCDIDMFASKRNFQLSRYVSYTPDVNAVAINTFSLNWNKYYSYIIPPFSVMGQVLQKLEQDKAEAILVVPLFSSQPWFPR